MQRDIRNLQMQRMRFPGTIMGDVAVLFKIYVDEGQEDSVSAAVKSELSPKGMSFDEIGFGIKVLKALFVHDDSSGSSEIEEKIRKIPGVTEVEVETESLV